MTKPSVRLGADRSASLIFPIFDSEPDYLDMRREQWTSGLVTALVMLTTLSSLSCEKSSDQGKPSELAPRVESNATPTPQSLKLLQPAASPSPVTPPAPPPQLDEVRSAMARVFAKAAEPETASAPAFVAGDFNGDGSTDLAVITKVSAASLKEINNELANWLLEDPRSVPMPGTNAANRMTPPKPVHAEPGDKLLAIIHGVGAKGWRNPEAKQTFLLKNGAGSNMTVLAVKDLAASGKPKLPPLRGDTISETVDGKSGMLFWTGVKYAWHPSPE